MHIEEFIQRVAHEPERLVVRTAREAPTELIANAGKPGGIPLTDFLAAARDHRRVRDVLYRHVLGSAAPNGAIDAWNRQHPSHGLPPDLLALVKRVNGIHLWASSETGRSYFGLAPIEEWMPAWQKFFGPTGDRSGLADRYVAISYHADGASHVVVDIESGRYFLMDAAGPDTTSPIASNAEELLDWLWQTRIAPTP